MTCNMDLLFEDSSEFKKFHIFNLAMHQHTPH